MKIEQLVGEFTPQNLSIEHTGVFYCLPENLTQKADAAWEDLTKQALSDGVKMWNGIVYRLDHVERVGEGYQIFLGTLDFKTHRVTSFLIDEIKNLPFEQRPNGMYICSFLRTADNKFIFGVQKSRGKSKLGFIGGNLNKDEMEIFSGKDLFDYFVKEFEEETQLSGNILRTARGVGIFVMPTFRIGVVLDIQLSATGAEALKLAKPNFEHDSLIALEKDKILDGSYYIEPSMKSILELC